MAVHMTVSDDDVVWALRQRVLGVSSARIAAAIGCSSAYVRAATNRVRAADMAESGEPADVVASAYWEVD
jgi:hypothetical protein